MRLDYTNPESLLAIVEALVFATDEPLSAQDIRSLILDEQIVKTSVEAVPDIFSDANAAAGGELPSATEPPKRKKDESVLIVTTRRQEATTVGNCRPQSPASNVSRAVRAASALAAV